ncbi:TolC family protein [Pontibacter sp. MBLB2868]|uniref:TolC family protein n=1 Tax=Pontibacter sp. MBLB2868 TaxID=3451555 RepID=UPI003F7545DA
MRMCLASIRNYLLLALLFAMPGNMLAQQLLTADEAVEKALLYSGRAAAVEQRVRRQRALEPTAFSIPAPELTLEQGGRSLSSKGIAQSLAFPTVYARQYKVQKQETAVAERERQHTLREIAYEIRLLYLDLQYAESLKAQLYQVDTLYASLAKAAARQFEAGQVDFLQKGTALIQYQEVHTRYLQSVSSCTSLNRQLQLRTGLDMPIRTTALVPAGGEEHRSDSVALQQNPGLLVLAEEVLLAQQQVRLARHKGLPNMAFEYVPEQRAEMGDAAKLKVGLSIPLWQWQYKGHLEAAKASLEMAEQERRSFEQDLAVRLTAVRQALQAGSLALANLHGSEDTMQQMVSASIRMLHAGELDHINLLRNINEACNIRLTYLQVVRDYNQAILTHNYLTGEL